MHVCHGSTEQGHLRQQSEETLPSIDDIEDILILDGGGPGDGGGKVTIPGHETI